ncbi:MAG: hypothetical protein WDN72_01950 [Alphaproteobacteria bacterium]
MDFFINANLGGRHHGWSGHHGGGFHAFATFDLSSLLGDHDAPEGHVSRRFRDELQNAAGSYAAAATAGPTDSRDIDRAGRAIDALSQLSGDDGKIRIPPGRDGGVEIPMGDSSTIFIPAGAYSTTDLAKAIGKEVQAPQNVQDAVVKAIADRANGTNDAGDAITRERHLRDSGATQPDGNGHDDTPAPSSTAARLANVELNYQSIIDAKTPLDRQYATRVYYKSLTTLADSNGNIPIDNTYDGKIGDKTIHVPASPDGKPYSRIEFTAMMGKQFGTENLTPAVISLANSWQEQPGEPPLPSRSTSSTQPDSTTPSTPPPATGTPTPLHPDPAPDQPLARDSKSVDYPTINAMGDAPAAMALLTTGTIPYTDGQGKPQANLSDALRAQAAFGHWTNALKGVNPAGMDPKQQDDAFVKALGFTSKEQAGQAFASIATAYDAADDKGKQDILKSAKDFYTAAQTAYPAVGNDIQKGILDRLQNPPQSGLQLKGIMDSLKGMLDKFSQAIQASVGPDTTTPNASTTPDGTGTPAPARHRARRHRDSEPRRHDDSGACRHHGSGARRPPSRARRSRSRPWRSTWGRSRRQVATDAGGRGDLPESRLLYRRP